MGITTGPNPEIQTQDMPTGDQLQAPASPAPAAPMHLDPGTPPITAISPNVRTHNFIARAAGGLLDALAGTPANYTTVNGKITPAPSAPLTTTQKIGRITGKLLAGLSAPTPSGPPSLTANIGAGAQAAGEKEQGQNILAKKQAAEDFEREQQATLHKHEIARQNALTLSTYFANKKSANDMTPIFGQNESLHNAVKASPELGAHATEMSDTQVEQEEAKDKNFTQTHIIKPMGWAPEVDADGKQVMGQDAEGNPVPKFYMRMSVVDGTKDGKIAVTPEMAADIKQYGPMARVPNADTIKAGDEYSLSELLPVMNKVDEQRKNILQGWEHSEMGEVTGPDGKPQLVETNKMIPQNMPGRTRPLTVTPLAVKGEEAKSDKEKADAFKARADGQKALAEAAMLASQTIKDTGDFDKNSIPEYMSAVQSLPHAAQVLLRSVPPIQQKFLLQVANGDAPADDATKNPRKGVPVLTPPQVDTYAGLLNPSWTRQMYTNKMEAVKTFNEKNGDALKSFGQYFIHADDAKRSSVDLFRTNSPWLNESINTIRTKGMGQPGVPGLMANIMAARSEWLSAIKSGHAADLADTDESRKIIDDSSTARQAIDALQAMGGQVIGRVDQIDGIWRRDWGSHFPGLITDSARTAIEDLGLGDKIKQYPREHGMFGVKPNPDSNNQNPSPDKTPNSHVFDAKAWAAANPGKDVNAAIASAKAKNYEIKQ